MSKLVVAGIVLALILFLFFGGVLYKRGRQDVYNKQYPKAWVCVERYFGEGSKCTEIDAMKY